MKPVREISDLWRDTKIVIKAVWLNLLLFAGLLAGAAALLRYAGAYPQANGLDQLVNPFHGDQHPLGDGCNPGVFAVQ